MDLILIGIGIGFAYLTIGIATGRVMGHFHTLWGSAERGTAVVFWPFLWVGVVIWLLGRFAGESRG